MRHDLIPRRFEHVIPTMHLLTGDALGSSPDDLPRTARALDRERTGLAWIGRDYSRLVYPRSGLIWGPSPSGAVVGPLGSTGGSSSGRGARSFTC